jgi:hypothetical protein
LFVDSSLSSVNMFKDLKRFDLIPFGGSIVSFIPFCRIGIGK